MKTVERLLLCHDLIASIIAAMEARDPYTSCHSMRVADMAEQLCGFMRIPEDETTMIHIAAHIHDLGKIGIEDSVLRKEGELNAVEWEKMKAHPVIGYTILSKIDHFSEIADIVRHHHERWDGEGYPDGIAGETIPRGSRIIAVADSIDAMLSVRSYRQRMDAETCRREIESNIGKMYDPNVASVVLKHWQEVVGNRQDSRSYPQNVCCLNPA